MSRFNEIFKELKDVHGYTLKDLEERLGIKAPNLSYYMNNREPNYDILCKIADYFGVTTDYLIGHESKADVAQSDCVEKIRAEKFLLEKENDELKRKLEQIKNII